MRVARAGPPGGSAVSVYGSVSRHPAADDGLRASWVLVGDSGPAATQDAFTLRLHRRSPSPNSHYISVLAVFVYVCARMLDGVDPADCLCVCQVRQARMAELVLAERKQTDAELARRGLAIYEQRI